MTNKRSPHQNSSKGDPKISKTIWTDLRRGDFKSTLRRNLKDIYIFYLDEDKRARLSDMWRIRRWLYLTVWLLKSMFLKLTPARRILALISVLFIIIYHNEQSSDLQLVGYGVLLLILMLELKDKLLAHGELATGRAVQSALMPKQNPSLSGWDIWLFTRSANEVGGDLVDYLMVSENRLGVALGDVAGKGLGAALLMAKLQATLRALAPNFDSLAELGAQINAILYRDGLPERFASLVYIELKPDSGQVRILNAGHLPPIALQGDKLNEMPLGAIVLGIIPESTYNEQLIELHPGDLLLVYSDGLTEACNEQGEFFGNQRLSEMLPKFKGLSAEAAGARLLAEVEQFIGNAPPSDDLSLVLLKRLS